MDEPMLRVWMTDSVKPAPYHETLPGRWVAEPSWPPPESKSHRLFLTDDGLRPERASLAARSVCSPQTVGKDAGSWCPFGRAADQAGDQRADDARSLVFETPPLDEAIEILGAAIVTLDVASDKPIANLAVRLCDVHPSAESLRVSFGVQNLTHRDGHEAPEPLVTGQRYQVRIQLNDAGAVFPVGHRIRLAFSTSYWPMIWPAPETATLTIFGGTLDLPVRPPQTADALLAPLPDPETATPERPTTVRPGLVRIDRLGLALGMEGKFAFDIKDDDPLSATAEMKRTETIERDAWQVRVETSMRLSCTRDAFLLRASLRAWQGADQVCHREWDRSIPRDLV
jgi:predicted acyl esterase